MSGEDVWRAFRTISGPSPEFGAQYRPELEDVAFSRQDMGTGLDQALTMDRSAVDVFVNPLSALASPPGLTVSRDAVYLGLERNQGNASDEVAPQFRMTGLANRFGSPLALIDWAPHTAVVPSGGYASQVRDDVVPGVAKMMPDQYYGVIDGQALLDEAVARTRRAMYGR